MVSAIDELSKRLDQRFDDIIREIAIFREESKQDRGEIKQTINQHLQHCDGSMDELGNRVNKIEHFKTKIYAICGFSITLITIIALVFK